jgi:hypothetical protein
MTIRTFAKTTKTYDSVEDVAPPLPSPSDQQTDANEKDMSRAKTKEEPD